MRGRGGRCAHAMSSRFSGITLKCAVSIALRQIKLPQAGAFHPVGVVYSR
ncbi:hypothetical protein BER2_3566 [plant metagenome]|uniref:Uncharacterized protein n=2 Tax=plant metagenome TaxID=1297885 RepID=A0A484RBQ7_9ZZZZ